MVKLLCLLVILGVVLTTCVGQWPLGPEFHRSMRQLETNLNNMGLRLEAMGERIAREQEARVAQGLPRTQQGVHIVNGGSVIINGVSSYGRTADNMRRAKAGVPFGSGGKVFITASGGLGYAYNSSDGSYTMYSLGTGSPPHGYMHHVGPFRTSFQSW